MLGANTIFISVSHQLTTQQTKFLTLVDTFLKTRKFHPVTVGRNTFSKGETILLIRDMIDSTQATLIIAFKRLEMVSGHEISDMEKPFNLSKRTFASIWNHIEAAMAIQARKPLLILCEDGIYEEGTFRWKANSPSYFTLEDNLEILPEHITDTLLKWLSTVEMR